ncbi:MAG: hypothetical protein WBA22_08165 [Candidatus Methanofastidiosia archaeon]
MEPGIRKIIGFASVCFAFALFMGLLIIQIYTGMYIRIFFRSMILAIIVIINGFYMMTGTKFGLSYDFWKRKFGGGYPLWFGAILDFYIDVIGVIIVCILLVIFVAPSQVQRLFVLFVGTTVVCLLLYFRFKDRRTLESYTPHR